MDAAPAWREPAHDLGGDETGSGAASGIGASTQRSNPGAKPDGWWDVEEGHQAREAWDMGFRGEGVSVAVLDNAVDFSHPDLQGTWRVLPDEHPYGGWAQVFDPYSSYLRIVDADLPEDESPSTQLASSGIIELYQTADAVETKIDGTTAYTTCVQPLVFVSNQEPRKLLDASCDFVVPRRTVPSRSGTSTATTLRIAPAACCIGSLTASCRSRRAGCGASRRTSLRQAG
jgi:hypothetical protein